jgi:hypothetical protein
MTCIPASPSTLSLFADDVADSSAACGVIRAMALSPVYYSPTNGAVIAMIRGGTRHGGSCA